MIRNIDSVVAVWPIGRVGGMRAIPLSEDISSKLFPKEELPSLELRKKYIREIAGIFSSPVLRNVRMYNLPSFGMMPLQNIGILSIPPLKSTGSLQIYTTSMKRLMEGYLVGVLTRKPLFDVYV